MLGGILGFCVSYFDIPSYTATSRFVLKESGPPSLGSSLGGLSSLFGISSASSVDRIAAVISTDKIIGDVLLTNCEIQQKKDLVINHFISLDQNSQWRRDTILSKARFTYTDTLPENFNYAQRKAYKTILKEFLDENGILESSFEKKSGIMKINVIFSDEDFAIKVNMLIFDKLKNYIRSQAFESPNLNSSILIKKVDSIQKELNFVRRQLARKTDQSFGVLLNEDKVELKSLAVKEQVLLTMYGEAQKNLETVLFMSQSASNGTNLILLDKPFSPIKPDKKSKILFTLGGFIFSAFFTFCFIVIRRWYKNLMAS
jgi:uncharacterized protein involved in exopolysaccharide biosynthesis